MNEDTGTNPPASDQPVEPALVWLWEMSIILDSLPARALEARRKALGS